MPPLPAMGGTMSNKGAYEYPAWCQMENALESYEQKRQEHLEAEAKKLGPEGERQLSQFTEAADALAKGVQELVGVDGIESLMKLAKMSGFQEGKSFELLQEHICITFGWEAMGILSTARERFRNLLMLLRDRRPSLPAKGFLQRVARCYLLGFDPECVVMCRAVLDCEFSDRVVDDDKVSEWWEWYKDTLEGRKYRGKKPPYGQLWARIQAARYTGLITEENCTAADKVRLDGNDAVHAGPANYDPLEYIEKTIQVLDALASRSD